MFEKPGFFLYFLAAFFLVLFALLAATGAYHTAAGMFAMRWCGGFAGVFTLTAAATIYFRRRK